jgi:hypothetical protein
MAMGLYWTFFKYEINVKPTYPKYTEKLPLMLEHFLDRGDKTYRP